MREQGLVSNYTVAVSDLTYLRVKGKWNYLCLFVDLFNREIIGRSAGANKTAELVYKSISSIERRLDNIQLFHTDRGSEFKNQVIDEALKTFGIERSLSMKGCPYYNAVAEATMIMYTGLIRLESMEHLVIKVPWNIDYRPYKICSV